MGKAVVMDKYEYYEIARPKKVSPVLDKLLNGLSTKEDTWWCCGVERPVSQRCSCGDRA